LGRVRLVQQFSDGCGDRREPRAIRCQGSDAGPSIFSIEHSVDNPALISGLENPGVGGDEFFRRCVSTRGHGSTVVFCPPRGVS